MARYTGPKDRLSRREGFDLFGKGSKLTRLNVPPGVHGTRMTRAPSQYGKQLREKQKAKRLYGIMEKQFKKYVDKAMEAKGNTGDRILSFLERRLDNTIYRLGFTPTRPGARQLVSHRHVLVNGKKLNIASYQVKIGDTISITDKGQAIPAVKKQIGEKNVTIPGWLKRKAVVGVVEKYPTAEDVIEPISIQDIVEYYSR